MQHKVSNFNIQKLNQLKSQWPKERKRFESLGLQFIEDGEQPTPIDCWNKYWQPDFYLPQWSDSRLQERLLRFGRECRDSENKWHDDQNEIVAMVQNQIAGEIVEAIENKLSFLDRKAERLKLAKPALAV